MFMAIYMGLLAALALEIGPHSSRHSHEDQAANKIYVSFGTSQTQN